MDVEAVAKGLSEAQRQALRCLSANTYPSRKGGLRKLGLVEPVDRDFHAWTPLGIAVRAHLLKRPD